MRRSWRVVLATGLNALLFGASGITVAAQESGTTVFDMLAGGTQGWIVVQDAPDSGDPPRLSADGTSLDVLTGAAGIFYRQDATASGTYRLEADWVQFDPGGRNEGFGLIFGGSDLGSVERTYSYVLLRQDGSVLLKRRAGARTPIVRDWFTHPAIRTWEARAPGTDQITNRLVLEVRAHELLVWVNETEILRVPRDDLATEGVVGLRLNHGVHIRVDRFLMRKPLD